MLFFKSEHMPRRFQYRKRYQAVHNETAKNVDITDTHRFNTASGIKLCTIADYDVKKAERGFNTASGIKLCTIRLFLTITAPYWRFNTASGIKLCTIKNFNTGVISVFRFNTASGIKLCTIT